MRPVAALALLAPALALAACDDAPRPQHRAAPTRTLPDLAATAAGPDDVVVATVDGRPVWGSCVAAQAALHGGARQAALDDCIDLELAAQEAERRGLAADPDVGAEVTRALAVALVDREITHGVQSVADLPASVVDEVWRKQSWRMHRPEYRFSFFARVELPPKEPEGSPADLAAAATARAAAAALAGRPGLFPADVEAAMRAAARPDQKITVATPEAATATSVLQAYYREPLFKLTAVGELTPPVRGPYGWDLILYTGQITALERTRDEVLAEMLPMLRMRWFMQWTTQLEKALGVTRYYDDRSLPGLLGEDVAP